MAIKDAKGPMISPVRLCHVVLKTQPRNYKHMLDWWLTFLGGHIVWGNEVVSFITYDDEHHRIAIVGFVDDTAPQPADLSRVCGMFHVAFAYNNLHDLLTTYVLRQKAGINPSWCTNHGPATSIYYRDPDGNEVETQVDNFETNEEATEFMKSAEFAENPIGVDFEPDELIKRLESGESDASLKKRTSFGPRMR